MGVEYRVCIILKKASNNISILRERQKLIFTVIYIILGLLRTLET